MTRVNTGISVECLTNEHLLAEHREIKRIPSLFKDRLIKRGMFKWDNDLPKEFTLNAGHVLFFLNKPNFTFNRYNQLYNECLKRGLNVSNYASNWDVYFNSMDIIQKKYINSYSPSIKDKNLLIERITIRIKESKKNDFRYVDKAISKDSAILLLNNI